MTRVVSLALLAGGIAPIIYGITASNSPGSNFSRFFTSSPTDRTVWLLIGGSVAVAAGVGGLLRQPRSLKPNSSSNP